VARGPLIAGAHTYARPTPPSIRWRMNMRTYRPLPSAARLNELLSYDPTLGVLRWKVICPGGENKVGKLAGLRKADGHIEVKVDGVRYQAHRLIWKMVHGRDPQGADRPHRPRSRQRASRIVVNHLQRCCRLRARYAASSSSCATSRLPQELVVRCAILRRREASRASWNVP
jgi:hypothetical protein